MLVVLDSNVFVSALIRTAGAPAQVLSLQRAGSFELVTSTALIAELSDVLARPRVARVIHATPTEIRDSLAYLQTFAVPADPTVSVTVCRDPADNRVLEAALAVAADYIVSGDQDLLVLGAFEGIPIVTPARFLSILTEQELR